YSSSTASPRVIPGKLDTVRDQRSGAGVSLPTLALVRDFRCCRQQPTTTAHECSLRWSPEIRGGS
ncbi:unnamed protein product, partial [Ectocarpus sp. 12 AP-2014]